MKKVDKDQLELYSSAVTLSDMEIFVFPELLYSLVLANIMSPIIWEWREDPWFKKIDKMSPYRRILRLKQFILDHYEFNLDLDTWGLTTQEKELERFAPFIDPEIISESNALFGYEGDKYYFDMDIRKHFGLEAYDSNIIPYWKTETLEAMDAFRHKEGYTEGAGECVSLSTMYAAALFIICKIPLDQIYLMATPLHSQNFVLVNDGVITNNRRIVTKNMWFNGSELTGRAQRALRNEQITIISHHTGYVHLVYPEATIAPEALQAFKKQLEAYLCTPVNMNILCNFLRQHSQFQKCFQLQHEYHGRLRYVPAEKAYAYEHGSAFRINDDTRDKLLDEIDEYEFFCSPIEERILLDEIDAVFKSSPVDVHDPNGIDRLINSIQCDHRDADPIRENLKLFCHLTPQFPDQDKQYTASTPIQFNPDMSREEIADYLESIREVNQTADLAFYAFRDLSRSQWAPFIKAALERNPVCVEATKNLSIDEIIQTLEAMPSESIYTEARLAQPDEVWNYERGDGLEKAICLAIILKHRYPDESCQLRAEDSTIELTGHEVHISWASSKGLTVELEL